MTFYSANIFTIYKVLFQAGSMLVLARCAIFKSFVDGENIFVYNGIDTG